MTNEESMVRHMAALGDDLAAENLRLRTALRGMVDNFRPFTVRPIGGEGSAARLDQEAQIKAHADAVALLRSADVRDGK